MNECDNKCTISTNNKQIDNYDTLHHTPISDHHQYSFLKNPLQLITISYDASLLSQQLGDN